MCGRVRCTLSHEEILHSTKADSWNEKSVYMPTENLAPGNNPPVLLQDSNKKRLLKTMTWGLVPSFTPSTSTPDFFSMYNARSESLNEKVAFKNLISRRRCVVIINGYYEWRSEVGKKQPYYLYFNDKRPMMIAGLYDVWKSETYNNDETKSLFYSVTMITGINLNECYRIF